MTWADAVPNFLIGLREGLEAGLVVSILLAALRKTASTGATGAAGCRAVLSGAVPIDARRARARLVPTADWRRDGRR